MQFPQQMNGVTTINTQGFSAQGFNSALNAVNSEHLYVCQRSSASSDNVSIDASHAVSNGEVGQLTQELSWSYLEHIETPKRHAESLFDASLNSVSVFYASPDTVRDAIRVFSIKARHFPDQSDKPARF